MTFLATTYQFKTRADYDVGATAAPITPAEATAAITAATRFIDRVAEVLPPGLTPAQGPDV